MKSFKEFLNDSRLEKPRLEQETEQVVIPKVEVPKPQPAAQPRVQRTESVAQPRVQPKVQAPVESVAKPKQVKKVISEWSTAPLNADPTVIPSHETQAPVEIPDMVRKMCGLDEAVKKTVTNDGELTEAEKMRKLCGFGAPQALAVNEVRKKINGPLQIDDMSFVFGESNGNAPLQQRTLTEQEIMMRKICGL